MNISELKGEKALDTLADILEPAVTIFTDEKVKKAAEKNYAHAISVAIKDHKKDVLKIMATLEGKPYKEYVKEVNVFTLPAQIIELINNEEIMSFFTAQVQMDSAGSSGFATENTKEKEN